MIQNNSTQAFDNKLKEHKIAEEERLMEYLSERYKIPVAKSINTKVNPNALQLIKEVRAREAKLAIYKRVKGVLGIAINEPSNPEVKKILHELEGKGFSHELSLASTKTLERIWEVYKDIVSTSATTPGTLSITNKDLEESTKRITSLESAKKVLDEMKGLSRGRRISKNVEYVVAVAIALDASDIHLEPIKDGGVIRYRVDGVLTSVAEIQGGEFKQLITRMKLVASMKITAKGAQDGGFVIHLSDRVISVRASVIPEEDGGAFVLRLLDPNNVIYNMKELGLHPVILEVFEEQIKKPNGLILTTGPTGSGKTTTLYSFLNTAKSEEVKTITLEDPIEYRLDGIVQTQIDKDYSFASGLRAILRQDPDIILVGEVRDAEVAEIAIQAALTGHLVFSTLHTNDALGALPRLAQLGIDPQTFSQSINIIIAQRLVRKLCPKCSETHEITDKQKAKIEALIETFPEGYKKETFNLRNIRKIGEAAHSCEHCSGGYKGRVGVFEVFEVNDEVEATYRDGGGITKLRDVVKKQNLPFIEQDGLCKALNSITSLEELQRVIGLNI